MNSITLIVLVGLLLSVIGTIYAAPIPAPAPQIYHPRFDSMADIVTQILGGM